MLRQLGLKGAICGLAMLATAPAWALGLGDISVFTRLNQPLTATVPILGASPSDVGGMTVRLASNDQYAAAGLDRADYLSFLSFDIESTASTPVIRISSRQAAVEPFLELLLEVRSGSTRVVRHYTVLLDPPGYALNVPAPAPAAAAAPVYSPTPAPSPAPAPIARANPAPAVVAPAPRNASPDRPAVPYVPPAAPVSKATAPAPASSWAPDPAAAPLDETLPSAFDGDSYGPVKPGETLWSVAKAMIPPGSSLSVPQAVMAVYSANPGAFADGRIDGLLVGSVLKTPSATQMAARSPVQAKAELDALMGRPALAAATPKPRESEPVVPATPSYSSSSYDSSSYDSSAYLLPSRDSVDVPAPSTSAEPVAAETATPVAVAPAAGDEVAPAAPTDSLSSADPTATAAPAPEVVPPAPAVETPAVVAAPNPAKAPIVQPVKKPAADSSPLLKFGIGGLLLLVLAGLGYVVYTRRKAAAAAAAAVAAAAAAARAAKTPDPFADDLFAAPVPTEPTDTSDADHAQLGDAAADALREHEDILATGARPLGLDGDFFENTGATEASVMSGATDDPLAEADFHISYGLFDEAALVLQQGLERDPHRVDLQMKLAETYFASGKRTEFLEVAEALRPLATAADWATVEIMGQQIAPDSPLFSGGGDFADASPAADAHVDDSGLLEISIDDFDEPLHDFDEPGTAKTSAAANEFGQGLDFDLGDFSPAAEATADDDFHKLDDAGLDFDLSQFDAPSTRPVEAQASAHDGIELLDFEVSSASPPPAAEVAVQSDQSWSQAASGGIETIDFDLSGDFGLDGDGKAAMDEGFGDFALGTDRGESLDISAGDDEVGTKLDLARAYVEMGDSEMARPLLMDVQRDGSDAQRSEADALLSRV